MDSNTTKNQAAATVPSSASPVGPNFKFERYLAVVEQAKSRRRTSGTTGIQAKPEQRAQAGQEAATEVRAGADALVRLLKQVKAKAEADLQAFIDKGGDDTADARDYPAIVAIIEADLRSNILTSTTSHREGYLRAMCDLLCMAVDGYSPVIRDWDPLASSAEAFALPPVASAQPSIGTGPCCAPNTEQDDTAEEHDRAPIAGQDEIFFRERLGQAAGIAALVARPFDADYSKEEQPDMESIFLSLDVARALLRQCAEVIYETPSSDSICNSGAWMSDVEGAIAMLDLFDRIMWADMMAPPVSTAELGGFLHAVSNSTRRAFQRFEASNRQ